MNIVIIYDCPLEECDKLWLYNGLKERNYNIKVICPKFVISRMSRKGIMWRIICKLITFIDGLKAIMISKKEDILLCWTNSSGVMTFIISKLLFRSRKIVAFNWLNPNTKGLVKLFYKKALEDNNFVATVNTKENKSNLINYYKIKDKKNIYFFQDIFDDNEEFIKPTINNKDRYCFTGGMNNRDWQTLLEVARINPHLKFKVVALKKDWNYLNIPSNVQIYFDISVNEYYSLVKDSYIVVLPLKENKASGLINIIKSIQYGKLCITTDLLFTQSYYPDTLKNLLCPIGDVEAISKMISYIYNYSNETYCNKVNELQKHLLNNFSPSNGINIIENIINKKFDIK